ncbi:MAG: hypothetical protein A2X94_15730 [Bdellovibrionales bacterium GWB1_55_8]|nr:MAG: hypothetical protein A2X94_15730 [Bdellovibrionales bacterium GWB1_55_8]
MPADPVLSTACFDRPAHWEREEVYLSGDDFFSAVLAGLRSARQTVDFEVYSFNDDELGRRVADELCATARRGVRVRVMVDGVGSPLWAGQFLWKLVEAGAHSKVYHPLPWVFWSFSTVWRRGFNRFLGLFLKVNRRNHRKVCIVDRRYAWLGSMNVRACHLKAISGEKAWRDTAVGIAGPGVIDLCAAFEKAWRRARGSRRGVQRAFLGLRRHRHELLSQVVRLNDTRGKRKVYQGDLLQRIARAHRRVWITNAYFVPNRQLLQTLRFAAGIGVDVRLIVPQKSDVFFMNWVVTAFYSELIGAGVRIFEYMPTILHSKTMIVDDWALIGSTNLNYRSWLHDLEVDVVLADPRSRFMLQTAFVQDQRASREVLAKDLVRLSWVRKLGGKIVLMFRYWI